MCAGTLRRCAQQQPAVVRRCAILRMSTARAREPRVRTAATSGSRRRWHARAPPVRAAATDGTRRHAASARRPRARACASSA
eukprot:489313-Pleurochrysis_carterae.AAC.1